MTIKTTDGRKNVCNDIGSFTNMKLRRGTQISIVKSMLNVAIKEVKNVFY